MNSIAMNLSRLSSFCIVILLGIALYLQSCGPENDDQLIDDGQVFNYDTLWASDSFKQYWVFDEGHTIVYTRTDVSDTVIYDTAIVIDKTDTIVFDDLSRTYINYLRVEYKHSHHSKSHRSQLFLNSGEVNTMTTSGNMAGIVLTWPFESDDLIRVTKTDPIIVGRDTIDHVVHTEPVGKLGDYQFWIARGYGLIKYQMSNGEVWQMSNLKD